MDSEGGALEPPLDPADQERPLGPAGQDPKEPEPTLSPAETLAMISEQQSRAGAQLEPDVSLLYGAWGFALLIGEGAMFLARWAESPIEIPASVAGAVLAVLLTAAAVITGVHSARRVAGVRGVSSRQGAYYGWAWMLGFVGLALIFAGVSKADVPGEVIGALWTSGSALVIGMMYMAGGAIWLDRTQFALGVWFVITAGVGGLLGAPWSYIVLSLAGGGGMLVVAGRTRLRGTSRP